MKSSEGITLISTGQLFDGTGKPSVPNAALVIENSRIAYAGPAANAPAVPPDARRIDARGGTIMPGLGEAHYHATYFNGEKLEELDLKFPVEYITLQSAVNCKLALECGYSATRTEAPLPKRG